MSHGEVWIELQGLAALLNGLIEHPRADEDPGGVMAYHQRQGLQFQPAPNLAHGFVVPSQGGKNDGVTVVSQPIVALGVKAIEQ